MLRLLENSGSGRSGLVRSGLGALAVLGLSASLSSVAAAAPAQPLSIESLSSVVGPTVGGTPETIAWHGLKFVNVTTGGSTGYGLTDSGAIYAWGQNASGSFGNGTTTGDSTEPTPVDMSGVMAGKEIVEISSAEGIALALDSEGQVYCWGYTYYGGCGNGLSGDTNAVTASPVKVDQTGVLAGKKVVQIGTGPLGTGYALTSDKVLYSWGYNSNGALGQGLWTDKISPRPAPVRTDGALAGRTIDRVVFGARPGALILTTDGRIINWGASGGGEMGTVAKTNGYYVATAPVLTDIGDLAGLTVKDMATWKGGSAVLTTDNQVFGIGAGFAPSEGATWLTGLNKIDWTKVDMNRDLSQEDITVFGARSGAFVVVTADGEIIVRSVGADGIAGDGTLTPGWRTSNVDTSGVLANETVVKFASAYDGTITALTESGKVASWGYNSRGVVGNGTKDVTAVPAEVTMPDVSVTFDGIPALDVTRVSSQVLTGTTPAHPSGDVDVTITEGGNANYPLAAATLTNGFRYGTAPVVVDDPDSVSANENDKVEFTAVAEGDETPTVRWEMSVDAGASWEPVDGSEGQASLDLVAAEALDGDQVRAVFANRLGEATSAPATLTLSQAPVDPPVDPVIDPSVDPVIDPTPSTPAVQSEGTGGSAGPSLAATGLGAAAAVALAAGLVAAGLLLRRRRSA